ncbi:MAG: hypothetical protein DMD76_30650 [Candidatus Rokuibacteriota bacterium]|nr:MAG: hypothetical protein DMD76_30650 [Candidatus Rokubacteria bacterium]
MARIAYFDCPSGAAGDMIMGALVDAGAPFEALRDGLHGLDLTGWDLVRHEVRRGDFRATKVDVQIDAAAHQDHRTLGDIVAILERSHLPAPVTERARRIFERLADAEARVHGTTRERVHYADSRPGHRRAAARLSRRRHRRARRAGDADGRGDPHDAGETRAAAARHDAARRRLRRRHSRPSRHAQRAALLRR